MSRLRQPVSAWIESLDRQLIRAKHVLLHGNTSDLALYWGVSSDAAVGSGCMSFESALHRYLVELGFELVLHFNAADGLQLVDPSMSDTFNRALSEPGASEGLRYDNRLNTPDSLIDNADLVRQILQQDRVSVAVVMHFADKLVGDVWHQTPEELQVLVRLKQALLNACFASNQTGVRNTFIGVACQLDAVPGWLYVDNPRVVLVPVNRPNANERRHWIGARLQEFHGASELTAIRQQDLVRELGDRTEGMSLFDISLLPRVSHAERIELASSQELVRAARFGKKEDPWRELDEKRMSDAEQFLRARVKGQDAAIEHVVSTIQRSHVGIKLGSGRAHGGPPKGVFFFVGPTGVGKTELARALADLIFGDDERMKVFNMAEYQTENAGERLAGSPPGYVGYEKGGQLTNHVLAEPFSVILFDEFEKAKGVNDKFLGILEEGSLTDGRGMTAYFDQTMLVFTSNIGSSELMKQLEANSGTLPTYEDLRALYLSAVEEHFAKEFKRPELRGRLGDNIVVFDMLRPELVAQLSRKFLNELSETAQRERQIELDIDENTFANHLTAQMQLPENLKLGGRCVRALIETLVERPLNSYVFTEKLRPGSRLHLSVSSPEGRISIRNVTNPPV